MNKRIKWLGLSFLCICLFSIFFFVLDSPNVKQVTIQEFQELVKNDEPFLLYVKRNDCPDCQKVDKKMATLNNKVKFRWNQRESPPVYEIDLLKEKDKEKTQHFLNRYAITEVPTFIKFTAKSGTKITLGHFFKLIF